MSPAEVEPTQTINEPQIPVVSFDTALGEDFDYVDVDYERLAAAMVDAGIPEDRLPDSSVHITSHSKARATGAFLKVRSTNRRLKKLETKLAKRVGYGEHQMDFDLPIMVQGQTLPSASRQAWDYVFQRSLNKQLPRELTHGFTSGDHLGIVISHESKHAADKIAGFKMPRKERVNLAAHAATSLLSKAGWTELAVNFFTGDKFIPYHPYVLASLGAVGTNFLFKNFDPAAKRYFRSQIERRANQYALDSLEKGENNPWRKVIYLQPK